MNKAKICAFVGGILFGTAGISILSSKDAKKVYTHCTAAVLRGKDCVMDTVTAIKENCEDIHADAVDINEERYAAEAEQELEQAKAIVEMYEELEAEAEAEAEEAVEE